MSDDNNATCRNCGKAMNVDETRNGDNLCKDCDMFDQG
jgi:NMD protein affecting ribosome stability and mRNA decay